MMTRAKLYAMPGVKDIQEIFYGEPGGPSVVLSVSIWTKILWWRRRRLERELYNTMPVGVWWEIK